MDQEDIYKLKAARPSFLDGMGLFPVRRRVQFAPPEPSRVIRTEAPIVRFINDDSNEEPVPTQPAPPECPTSGAVTCVVSGVVSCGCSANQIATFSIDGTYTLTWDAGSSAFIISGVGSFSQQGYSDSDCTIPFGDPSTGAFEIQATCSGGQWSTVIQATGGAGFTVFASASAVPFGSPADNNSVCPGGFGGGGNVTIS